MKPLSLAQRAKLTEAWDFVTTGQRNTYPSADIIAGLVERFGATVPPFEGHGYTLRCAGVTGTCTWSADAGLLRSWHANAGRRLGMANVETIHD